MAVPDGWGPGYPLPTGVAQSVNALDLTATAWLATANRGRWSSVGRIEQLERIVWTRSADIRPPGSGRAPVAAAIHAREVSSIVEHCVLVLLGYVDRGDTARSSPNNGPRAATICGCEDRSGLGAGRDCAAASIPSCPGDTVPRVTERDDGWYVGNGDWNKSTRPGSSASARSSHYSV